MGCDIHLRVERKNEHGQWQPVNPPADYAERSRHVIEEHQEYLNGRADDGMKDYYETAFREEWYADRNYYAFGILAGVRNEGFRPISKPRGLPDDLSPVHKMRQETEYLFGDHSFTWLTVKELLDFDWNQRAVTEGIIPLAEFQEREQAGFEGRPDSFCRGVSGPRIRVRTEKEVRTAKAPFPDGEDTYVHLSWSQTYADAAGRFHSAILPELAKIDPKHPENVRVVFGFDS